MFMFICLHYFTDVPTLGYTRLPRPLGYTRLPRPLGYTWLPRPVRVRSWGGWDRNGIRITIRKSGLYDLTRMAHSQPLFGKNGHFAVSLVPPFCRFDPVSLRKRLFPGFVCLSVCLSVHTCRLGIERKMAQAQQIRSNILQNHEST